MSLLAAGALCAAAPALGQVNISTVPDLNTFLNTDEDVTFLNDLDLLGGTFAITRRTQFFGDTGTETISNGTIFVGGSTSDTNYVLFNITPSITFTGDITLDTFARLDIDDPASLGLGGTVTADEDADIRLFTGDGGANTWDTAFFAKITGIDDSTSFSITGDGVSTLTALPTFDAIINLNIYNDFDDFEEDPALDPTLTLGATLAGNHEVNLNAGTLNLNDFDFTIDSLSGVENTEVTLGSGTLTTGDAIDTTYAGVISGTGNLVKTGSGIFTLSGVNTFTGTVNVTDGTLVFEADQSGFAGAFVRSGSTLLINADQTSDSFYEVSNGGTLTVNADLNDATGLDTQGGGVITLNLVDQTIGALIGITGTLTLNNVDLTVDDDDDTSFGGVLNGTGNFTKTGTGNLTLSGINTFAGTTTISGGTLTLDGDLTNTSVVSIAAGAILDLNDNDETLRRVTGAGDIDLGTATLTLDGNGNETFGGTISGTGDLTKEGNGSLTLTGAQTYTGATNINNGSLIANADLATSAVTVSDGTTFALEAALTTAGADVTVDDGGTLFGTGTIADDLTNNGTVTFLNDGSGDTLTVNGDYTQGSTGLLEVQLGSAGGLVVAGNADLDGTLDISTPLDPAGFDISATYQVLNAGSTSGSFTTITDSFAFLDLTSNIVGGNVEVTLARNAVALSSIARTTNQTTVANVLDSLGAPTGNLDSAIDRILASSEAQALATYDDLAGAGAATVSTQIAANAVNQSHRVLDQIIGVAPGTNRPTGAFSQASSSPANNTFDDADYLTLLSYTQSTADQSQETEGKSSELQPTAWGAIYGGFGDQGDGAEGLDYTRYGLLIGLEFESAESETDYGLTLGVEQSEFDFNQDNGDVDITSLYLSGYARMPFGEGFNFTVNGGLGFHMHESTRNILIGVTPTQANADFDSISLSIAAELSKSFDIIHKPIDPGTHPTYTSIEPFVRLDYSISEQDGYSETGAGTAGLVVGDSDYDSTRVAAGVRMQREFMLFNQYEANFQARGLANFALDNSDSGLNVSFVGTPGSGFAIEGSDQDDVYGQIGVGLTVEINDFWDMHLGLDQQFSSDALGTVIAGGLSYEF